MSDPNLGLRPGDNLQIQFLLEDGRRVRPSVRIIGVMPGTGGSIIVTAPELGGRLMMVREGQMFVARSFSGELASAFSCRALRLCSHPYPYLHLSYPDNPEQVVIRNSRRVSVLLAATAQRDRGGDNWSVPVAAILSDISTAGAMLETSEPLGAVGTKLRITINVPIEDMDEQKLVLEASIRSSQEDQADGGRCRAGVQFLPPNAQHRGIEHGQRQIDKNLREIDTAAVEWPLDGLAAAISGRGELHEDPRSRSHPDVGVR